MSYTYYQYYKTCNKCGANLDPGESCDCEEVTVYDIPTKLSRGDVKSIKRIKHIMAVERDGRYTAV